MKAPALGQGEDTVLKGGLHLQGLPPFVVGLGSGGVRSSCSLSALRARCVLGPASFLCRRMPHGLWIVDPRTVWTALLSDRRAPTQPGGPGVKGGSPLEKRDADEALAACAGDTGEIVSRGADQETGSSGAGLSHTLMAGGS